MENFNLKKQIEKLYEYALSFKNKHLIIDIGIIDENLANRIKEITNIDFTGYLISIDNYSIRHTLEKHGNPIKEAKRGQINITKDDFLFLPEIIYNFDNVKYDINNNNKASLIFEKVIRNHYFVVKEIRTVKKKGKKNRIILQTMYKKAFP